MLGDTNRTDTDLFRARDQILDREGFFRLTVAERARLAQLHQFEDAARQEGFRLLGGVDEVGRGPLAGPVVAACVVADGPLDTVRGDARGQEIYLGGTL